MLIRSDFQTTVTVMIPFVIICWIINEFENRSYLTVRMEVENEMSSQFEEAQVATRVILMYH